VIAPIAAPTKHAYLASQKAAAQAQIVTAAARLAALLGQSRIGKVGCPTHFLNLCAM
jgi:hypothetical protein